MEWKLSCVLPDIPSDKIQGELDIEECLTISPSKQTGNGIFMANFQLKPLVHDTHRQEDAETLAKKLAEQSIASLEKEVVQEKPKRKKKPLGRKRGEPLKIRLPKALRASVERLSIPRLFSAGREKFEFIRKRSLSQKSLSSKNQSQTEFEEAEQPQEYQSADEVGAESHPKATGGEEVSEEVRNVDIGVYGISIKKFFNPRAEAIEALKTQHKSLQKIRWAYPIPNPTVWK